MVGGVESLHIGARDGVFTATNTIASHLKSCWMQWDALFLTDQSQRYSNLQLWTLHVGAQWEWTIASKQEKAASQSAPPGEEEGSNGNANTSQSSRSGSTSSQSGAVHGFFNQRIASLCQQRRLHTWMSVQAILQGFVYTDIWAPHGSTWFHLTVSAFENGKSLEEVPQQVQDNALISTW